MCLCSKFNVTCVISAGLNLHESLPNLNNVDTSAQITCLMWNDALRLRDDS